MKVWTGPDATRDEDEAIMLEQKESKMIKIVYNKLLGAWYVVRGPHHFPLAGPFATKDDAEARLAAMEAPKQ